MCNLSPRPFPWVKLFKMSICKFSGIYKEKYKIQETYNIDFNQYLDYILLDYNTVKSKYSFYLMFVNRDDPLKQLSDKFQIDFKKFSFDYKSLVVYFKPLFY